MWTGSLRPSHRSAGLATESDFSLIKKCRGGVIVEGVWVQNKRRRRCLLGRLQMYGIYYFSSRRVRMKSVGRLLQISADIALLHV